MIERVHPIRWAIGATLLWLARPVQWFVLPVQRERARIRAEAYRAEFLAERRREAARYLEQWRAANGIRTSAEEAPASPAVRGACRPAE